MDLKVELTRDNVNDVARVIMRLANEMYDVENNSDRVLLSAFMAGVEEMRDYLIRMMSEAIEKAEDEKWEELGFGFEESSWGDDE